MKRIRDKLFFEEIVLGNGMKVYAQVDRSVDFAGASLVAPVGSAHNAGPIIQGAYHYLEHMKMKRSERYPESGDLKEKANLLGGRFGAGTWFGKTSYDMKAPTSHWDEMFAGLLSHFYHSVINESEVQKEQGVIISERKRRETFYPAGNERGWYASNKWKLGTLYSPDQTFGTDDEIRGMTAEYFRKISAHYATPASYLVIAGNFDLTAACKRLEEIELYDVELPKESYDPVRWVRPEFHEFATAETSRFEYLIRSIYKVPANEQASRHSFTAKVIGEMLANYSFGSIIGWLRHEQGSLYEVNFSKSVFKGIGEIGITIPQNSRAEVDSMRSQLQGRIFDTLGRQDILDKAKQVLINSIAFSFQTIESRLDEVLNDLHIYGKVDTVTDYVGFIEGISTDYLKNFAAKNLLGTTGELLMVPK